MAAGAHRGPRDTRPPPPDGRSLHHDGDGWVDCRCGAQHWGRFGAAGLLISDGGRQAGPARLDGAPPISVVLQHRALWSHHGGTWGIPGGALGPAESAVQGAVRESVEEADVPENCVRAWASTSLVHPDWSYTTIVAEATAAFTPTATDAESLELAWVPSTKVMDRNLLPAFRDAWPALSHLVGRRVLVVVDGANVVGSRPDGWWRDRAGAAARLHAFLSTALLEGLPAATLGLPADRWWPDVLLVLEGAARAADVGTAPTWPMHPGPHRYPTLAVARAAASGDDTVVAATARALDHDYTDVIVVTADRALGQRVRTAGGAVAGPGAFLAALA